MKLNKRLSPIFYDFSTIITLLYSGPVLREAVRALLEKREMQYTLAKGKGSFLVNACSGHELTAAPALQVDSKVMIVAPSNNTRPHQHGDVRLVNRPRNSRVTTIQSSARYINNTFANNTAGPKPCQVAEDDALMARVKSESHYEFRQAQRMEHSQLKRAISNSKQTLEWKRELDARRQQEDIAAALEESTRHEELLQQQEETQLEEILQLSRDEEERIRRQEEEKLAAILQQSQQEEELKIRQEQEALERALALSQTHVSEADVELNQALQRSLHDTIDSRALSVSRPPDKLPQMTITPESTAAFEIENVDYVIEEVD